MKTLSIYILSSIVVLGLLQACTDGKSEGRKIPVGTEPIPVKVMDLARTNESTTIIASGQITTEDESLLAFKTGGVVERVLVKEGDRVHSGQLLATLNLTEIDALVAQAGFAYEKEERDYQRVTNLYHDSVATLEQLQNVRTSLAVARERLEAAKFNRSYSEIHAPHDGYVLRKFVSPGRVVGVGEPILLTNSASSGKWLLKVGVSDKEWSAIKPGDSAVVRVDAFPNSPVTAIVSRKAESADPVNGAFSVELQLKNSSHTLATGMFGAATIHGQASKSVWRVPYEAVLDAHGDEGFVFVTRDGKRAIRKAVTIDSFDGSAMHILEGLEAGDALIVAGSAYLADQSPIRVIK